MKRLSKTLSVKEKQYERKKRMKKETWKKVAAIGAAAVLSLSLFACGSSKSDDQAKKDTEEKKPTAQDFTTKDGKYKITADSDWSEPDTYGNDESALEIEIAGGLTSISIIDQSKSGLGYDLKGFSKEVTGYITGSSDVFSDAQIESTKEFTCGSYKTIENVVIVTEKTTEMKMAICHLSIETDSDYVQFIVMSTESNKDKVISYAEGIGATLTAL